MATITREALEWVQDQLENLQSQVDELEEELSAALDDGAAKDEIIASLKSQLAHMKATLQAD